MRSLLVFIGALLLFASCGNDLRVFDENEEIDNGVWKRNEELSFDLDIKDSTKSYQMFYNVRNSIDYPFYNLYLRMQLADSTGKVLYDQDHELILFHPQTGEPMGKKSFFTKPSLGDIFDQIYPAVKRVKFPYAGKYQVKIRQFMRKDESIDGIYAVGLRVDELSD